MKGDLLIQGAEARVYEATIVGKSAVIKHRFSKKYRHPDVDAHITKERMKAEARSLTRCRMLGIRAPCVYDVDFTTSEITMSRIENSITVRNLVYKYCSTADKKQQSAVEVGTDNDDDNKNVTTAAVDSATTAAKNSCDGETCEAVTPGDDLLPEMKSLAVKIGAVLSKLHQNNIIHGDLTTSNMLLVEPYEKSDIIMIDFGLSSMEEKAEDKAVDLYVLERAMLSTHPNTDKFVLVLLKEYERIGGKAAQTVIKKLDEVRMRGRKKLCFG